MSLFAAICFLVSAALITIGLRPLKQSIALINIAAAVAAFGLFDIYAGFLPSSETHDYGSYTSTYFTPDPGLGYVIAPGSRVVTSEKRGPDGSTIYNVEYTVDRFGLRRTVGNATGKAIFFFGDSFTFGEGVDDSESLPQQFAAASGVRVLNFGVPGYGPHQVLRELEINRPRAVDRLDPKAIVLLTLPSAHMMRAAGRAEWDPNGPRYEVVNGNLQYQGHFVPLPALQRLLLRWSNAYAKFLDARIRRIITTTDRQRLLAILLRIQAVSRTCYHAPFFVVLWDVHKGASKDAKWLRDNLREHNVSTLALSEAAPQLQNDSFYLPIDGHPTGKALQIAANALKVFLEQRFGPSY